MKKIVAVILLAASANIGFAQQDTVRKNLDEVVVTANKFQLSKKQVAQRMDVVTKQEINWMNALNSADLLSNTGNILCQKSQGGGGSPILRGFESSRVLLEVDGLRINNAIFRGGHLQNVLRIDNNMLERVEVLYGPSSAMHGSDALGGVMNFITKQPVLGQAIGGNAMVRYSSATGEKTAHADVNVGGSKIASLTSITYSDFGDIVQGSNRKDKYPTFGLRPFYVERIDGSDVITTNSDPDKQVGTAYRQYDLMEKVLFKPNATTTHTLNLQYSNSSDVTRYDRLTETNSSDIPTYAEWYYGPEERILTSYRLDKKLNTSLMDKLSVQVAWQRAKESRNSRKFSSSKLKQQFEEVNVFSFDVDGYKKLNRQAINYGFEAYLNDVQSTATNTNIKTGEITKGDSRYPDGGNNMNTFALYAQDHITLVADRLYLTAGLRYNYSMLKSTFSSESTYAFPFATAEQNNGCLSGTGGLVYTPGKATRLALGVSTGFRTPNVDDMSKVFESVSGMLIIPNPDLKPEYTTNFEVSINQTIAEKINVEAGAFYTAIDHAIVTDEDQYNGQDSVMYNGSMSKVYSSQNKQEAYIYGAYGQMKVDLAYGFSLDGTINYTYGRVVEDSGDTPLDHIPPLFGKAAVQYRNNKLQGELSFVFCGKKDISDYRLGTEDNEVYATADGMPSWNTLNIRVSYQVARYLNVQLGCDNIFDTNYRVFGSGVSAPGRNFRITLRTAF